MSQALAFVAGLAVAFVLFDSFHSSAKLGFSSEFQKGEWALGVECVASGPTAGK